VSQIRIPLDWLSEREGFVVEVDEGMVALTVDAPQGLDVRATVAMRPEEARALAAVLVHYATEVTR